MGILCLAGYTINVYKSQGKQRNMGEIINEVYTNITKDPLFIDQAIRSSISYLTDTYDIKNDHALYLQGPYTSMLFQRSFKDLLLISSDSYNDTSEIPLQTSKINEWIDYSRNLMGSDSVDFALTANHLKNHPELSIFIKINRNRMIETEKCS